MAYAYETADAFSYTLLKNFAKENRKNMTDAEEYLWRFLKKNQLGVPFRKQHIIGMFIADFFCLPSKLIIEIDGLYHSIPEQQISDEERTKWLKDKGYKVIRFTNEEVLYETNKVLTTIKTNL